MQSSSLTYATGLLAVTLSASGVSAIPPASCPGNEWGGLIVSGRTDAFAAVGGGVGRDEPESVHVGLKKGRKGYVLVVEATATTNVPAADFPWDPETELRPVWLHVQPWVNGVGAALGSAAVADCGGSGRVPTPASCTVNGKWWLDLDLFDDDRTLIGRPLCIDLQLRDLSPNKDGRHAFVEVSLHARLVKK